MRFNGISVVVLTLGLSTPLSRPLAGSWAAGANLGRKDAAAGGDTIAPASGFGVIVRPTVVASEGDTVTLAYVVTVIPTAHDSLVSFMVDAPGVLQVRMPGAWPEWRVGTRWQTRPIADWGKDTLFIAPGDSTPALQFTARGLLDIVTYWAEVNTPEDSTQIVTPVDSSLALDSVVTIHGITGFTVGVGAMPTDLSSAALAMRLSSLIDRACDLGWIDNKGVCNSLQVKVKPQAGPLRALLNELSAQRGKHVCETAYVLLSANIQFLLGRL